MQSGGTCGDLRRSELLLSEFGSAVDVNDDRVCNSHSHPDTDFHKRADSHSHPDTDSHSYPDTDSHEYS